MASRSAHVDFVGLLFIIWGLLTTLIGVSTLALGVGAIALITSASRRDAGGQIAAGLTAAAFTTLAVIALVWGTAPFFPASGWSPSPRHMGLLVALVSCSWPGARF
jgi:hypothetical protein